MGKKPVAALSLISVSNDGDVFLSTVGTKAAAGSHLVSWSLFSENTVVKQGLDNPPGTLAHKYNESGNYYIKLVIKDNKGRTAEMGMIVRVDQVGLPIPDPPPPDPPVPPPTDPPPAIGLVTYNFLTTGWTNQLAMTFPMGMIPNLNAVQIGAFPTQFTVKRTWQDGSARHAIVKANITVAGNHDIIPVINPGGSYTPSSWPSVSVSFIIGPNIYTANLGAVDLSDTWENGLLCRSARKKVTPMNGATPHPLLRVWFDVSSYLGGGHVVDISVNDIQDKVNGDQLTYDVSVVIDGVTRYTKNAHNQKYLTRPRLGPYLVNLNQCTYVPDFSLFYQSGALPEFSTLTSFAAAGTDEQNNNFTSSVYDIGEFGFMTVDMGASGGRPEIEIPYPDWVARWLVNKNQGSFSMIKKMADLSASWSGHIVNDDDTFITMDTYSHYWIDSFGRSNPWPQGPKASLGAGLGIQGCGPFIENAHLPQIVYPAYVLTGDRFYCDQLALWASASILLVWPAQDSWYGSRISAGGGIMQADQTRAVARGCMTMQDAACYLPDGHQLVSTNYLKNIVVNNINWLDADCAFVTGGPFHYASYWIIKGRQDHFGIPGWIGTFPWQDTHVQVMIWKARKHRMTTTQGNTFMTRIASMWKELLSNPDWPIKYAAQTGHMAIPDAPAPSDLDNPYSSTSRVYSNSVIEMRTVNDTYGPGGTPLAGYYGPYVRQGLMIGENMGINTDTELALVLAQPGVLADLAARSGSYVINFRDIP